MKIVISTTLFLSIFSLGAGCSFKPTDEDKQLQQLTANEAMDSDGDGKTDLEEQKSGENPFIADVPIFNGDFFQEMKVTTFLYNPGNNNEETVSFQVRKDFASENGTPYEERDFLSQSTQYILEQNSLLAKRSSYRGFHQVSDIGNDQLEYYSSPRMNDLKIFPYSSRIALLSETHQFEGIEFSVLNRLNFSFKGAQTFTDITINLYWFDDQRREFILIGSDFLKGVYQFNRDYHVPLTFKSNDKSLVKSISINGGRYLYLKVVDFKIVEMNRFYGQILDGVKEKSIPVMVSARVQHIGLNGRPTDLKTILDRAVIDQVQIINNKIVRIGTQNDSVTIENDPYGDRSEVENKWFLLTNEIGNNPFSYSFSPQDTIALSYLSNRNSLDIIPSYFGSIASTENYQILKTINVLKNNFLDIRLNLRPSFVTYPINSVTRLLTCNSTPLSKSCFEFKHEVKTLKGIQALKASSFIYVMINDTEFRLDQLIDQKHASFRVKNSEVIEIKFNESLISKFSESNGITITFSTKSTKAQGCTGMKICESNQNGCEKYGSAFPTCEEEAQNNFYILKDLTQKTFYPISGETFFSIEYI